MRSRSPRPACRGRAPTGLGDPPVVGQLPTGLAHSRVEPEMGHQLRHPHDRVRVRIGEPGREREADVGDPVDGVQVGQVLDLDTAERRSATSAARSAIRLWPVYLFDREGVAVRILEPRDPAVGKLMDPLLIACSMGSS